MPLLKKSDVAKLSYGQFFASFRSQPYLQQLALQREAGFSVAHDDWQILKRAQAIVLGLPGDASTEIVIYYALGGKQAIAAIGKPSLRLEFKSNDDLIDFAQARGIPQALASKKAKAGEDDFFKQLAALVPAVPGSSPAAPTAKRNPVANLQNKLANAQPITKADAAAYPALVQEYAQLYEELGIPMFGQQEIAAIQGLQKWLDFAGPIQFEWDKKNVGHVFDDYPERNNTWPEIASVLQDQNAFITKARRGFVKNQKIQKWEILGLSNKGRLYKIIFAKYETYVRIITAIPTSAHKDKVAYEQYGLH